METQDDQKLQTETAVLDDLKTPLNELDLLDNMQKLSNDDALETNDNEIFNDVIKQIKLYAYKSKQEKLEKDILLDEWQIFHDFFTLIEKHGANFTDKDLLVVERELNFFIDVTNTVNPDNAFTAKSDHAKHMFYIYFNLLNFSIIQNFLKNDQQTHYLKIPYNSCIRRIFRVMQTISLKGDLNPNDHQRPNNSIELLSLVFNYVKINLESLNVISEQSLTDISSTRSRILSFICNYSDNTILVPDLIKAGCLEIIVNGFKMVYQAAIDDYDLREALIMIIQNISLHDYGAKKLNALNTIDVIKTCQNNINNAELNTLCCRTLALLSTPEQIKKDNKYMNDVLDTLLKMVYEASISQNHRTDTGAHLSELLIVFVKIFNDDRTLDYIMEYSQVDLHAPSTIDFFINLLINYHSTVDNKNCRKRTICTALVNILWSISFQDKYKQKLKNANTNFKELIKNMTKAEDEKFTPNQYVPDYLENIQNAAEGILVNIDEVIQPAIEKQIDPVLLASDNNQKSMIMISYSHKDIDFCKQLYNKILEKGYDIWIDFKFIKTGDLWETIAAGMKQANVIICLMSESYCKSKSCRLEATYALDKLQATISVIPVFLREYELPNWLEIRTAILKYVRFRDLKQLEHEKLLELMDMIEASLSTDLPHIDLNIKLPVHYENDESITEPMMKDNEVSSENNNIHPLNDKQSFETKLTRTKIEKQDNLSKNDPVICTTNDENIYKDKPIEEWNKTDISQWFENNEVICEFRDLCQFKDGYELLNYAKIFLDTEKFQYHLYSDEFLKRDGITSGKRPLLLHEFTKFSNALRKLEKSKK